MFLPARGNGTPNNMSAKFVFLTAFLCCSLYQLASTAEANDIKEHAIQKLNAQRKLVDEYIWKVSHQTENNVVIIQTQTRKDHAGALKYRTDFEIKQIGAAYRLIAELMNANKYVIQCMEEVVKKAHFDIDRHHLEIFYRPVHQSHVDTGNVVMRQMRHWFDRKQDLNIEYVKLFDETVAKIGKSDSQEEIKSLVDVVLQKGEKIIEEAKKVIRDVRKVEADQVAFIDDRLAKVREFTRKNVDLLGGALQNCFLIKTPFFNLRNIFIKENLS